MTLPSLRFIASSFTALVLVLAQTTAQGADQGVFLAPTYSPDTSPGADDSARSNVPAFGRTGDPPPASSAPTEPLTKRTANGPRKPSEFQKFVETATGRELQVFGSEFFETAGANFSPVDNAPVAADYTVGPGDEMNIRAWGSIEVDYRAKVDRNGQVSLPKIGSFTVAGIKASALENHLRAQIGRLYTNFNLNVSLGQLRGVKVFVVGPARLPGVYTVSSQSTILTAVVAAGGPAAHGSMRKVLLRREDKVISELDMYDFLVHGDKSKDVQLATGDVVVFQPVGPRVALNGALDTPAIYELKAPQEPAQDVLGYAGGLPVLSNPNEAQLERIGPVTDNGARVVENFKLDAEGLKKPMRDGDLLTLLAISPQFTNAVTLKGHVAQPLRHPFKPGMRIRDLIPDQDALISPDFYRRKNLLVQLIDADAPEATRNESRTLRDKKDHWVARNAAKIPAQLFEEVNWDYAVVERLNKETLSTMVLPFNLGKAVLQNDPDHNLELQPGDVVTVYGQQDIRAPISRQSRLVSLEGEIGVPGMYQLKPGETLQQLIIRAGGFTRDAYVYAIEFSREETRKRQKENLDLAIARLEALLAVQNARATANIGDSRSAEQAAAVNSTTTQAQITRLKRIQPNGRVTLELESSAKTVEALPFLPLEHGDRVIVPTRPGFVTVAGAVVNTNAYLWREGRTAGEYLDIAGIDEGADRDNMFIMRANGVIVSRTSGLFSSNKVKSVKLEPGDAVVVPNQLDYETWGRTLMRNLKDFSQILSQFGLGAAAIVTLRR